LTVSVVLADANILFSRTLRDYFLYVADHGAIEIHWSQQILDEMSGNLRENLGLSSSQTSRLEDLMNDYIEYALVDVSPRTLMRSRRSRWTRRIDTSLPLRSPPMPTFS
jgi:hypothetical protein